MPKLVADVAVYQSKDISFFEKLKQYGFDAAMVKLTEATTYVNQNAASQIANAYRVFGTVGIYHFFHGNGVAEAKYFLAWAKKYGLDKTTVMALDVEYQGLPKDTTNQVNAFLNYLKAQGYSHVITYGSGSWFKYGRINRSSLVDHRIWVAAYGVTEPGIANANAWQFTDNYRGLKVDASYDFDGSLSGSAATTKKAKPAYWSTNGLYEVIADHINVYGKVALDKAHQRRIHFTKGSTIYGKAIKYGQVYRIKTDVGYISANKDYVKLIRKSGGQ